MFKSISPLRLMILPLCMAVICCFYAPAMAQEVPFTGEINQESVTLRAGAGTPYYIVGRAGKGTRVTVSERIADWYKITPPPGVYSYVSKAFVDVRGDGSTGTARQRLSSYAASVNGPGESYRRQLELLAGDVVKIVAQEGSYFKIEPPKGAYVYIQTQYINPVEETIGPAETDNTPAAPAQTPSNDRPASPVTPPPEATPETTPDATPEVVQQTTETAREVTPESAPESTPASPSESTPETAPEITATPATADQPQQVTAETSQATSSSDEATDAADASSPAAQQPVEVVVDEPAKAEPPAAQDQAEQRPLVVSPDLLAAEQAFYDAQKLPVEKQPLEALLEQYQKVQSSRSLTAGDQRVISVRIAQLQRNMTLAKAIDDLKEVRRELKPSTTILVPPPAPADRSSFDAMGVLLASSVYDGQTLPRLYRLVTSGEGRTIAYIRPTGSFDVAAALGSTVGIQGQTRYDTALKIRVIDAEQLVILEPAAATE